MLYRVTNVPVTLTSDSNRQVHGILTLGRDPRLPLQTMDGHCCICYGCHRLHVYNHYYYQPVLKTVEMELNFYLYVCKLHLLIREDLSLEIENE
jgi:hypothetical protein